MNVWALDLDILGTHPSSVNYKLRDLGNTTYL